MMKALAILLLAAAPALADTSATHARTVTELAPGVWTIRHPDAPDEFPQSNTTVIEGARELMVVDSCYLPSAAREDIAEIRRRTSKPVRWLVNTHWHYDHTMGNGEYAAAFPGLQVIAQAETARNMAGYNPRWFARYPQTTDGMRKQLASGVGEDGKTLTDEARAELTKTVAGREPVQKEFAAVHDHLPDVSFDRSLEIDLGARVVRLLFLGRGNTAGDAVVFLPAEKIVLTGDLLTSPIPYLGGGYPSEYVATLGALEALGASVYVPGHGDVQRSPAHLRRVREFVSALLPVMSDVVYASGRRGDYEAVRAEVVKRFDVAPWRQAFAGDDKEDQEFFDGFAWPGLLKAAHAEMWRR